jgi:hypothetical protein
MATAVPGFFVSIKNGEVDNQKHAETKGEGIGLEVAGLEFAEQVPEGFDEAAQPSHQKAVDQEFIEEVDYCCKAVLEKPDQAFFIDRIQIETIAEERDGNRVFFPASVEEEPDGYAENKRCDRCDEGNHVGFVRWANGAQGSGDEAVSGEDRKNGQDRERDPHQRADLMGMAGVFRTAFTE